MAPAEAPTLTTNITEGHSRDCKHLDVEYYRDLFKDITTTIAQIRESLYEYMDSDIDFVDKVDAILSYALHGHTNFQNITYTASRIQELLNASQLSPAEREQLWQPIAQCYQRVQEALDQRIIPLEERELIGYGDLVAVPVRTFPLSSRIGAHTAFPRFKFALRRHRRGDGEMFRDDLTSLTLRDRYLETLPDSITSKLPRKGTIDLPLRIVYVEYGMITAAEIDEEAFHAMHG